jgi:hypothetical protein
VSLPEPKVKTNFLRSLGKPAKVLKLFFKKLSTLLYSQPWLPEDFAKKSPKILSKHFFAKIFYP